MDHQTETSTAQEGTVFQMNRTLETATQALLWLVARGCSQVKFDLLGSSAQLIEQMVKRESDGEMVREIRVKDRISPTSDLLYGISFSVAIADLYLWFQSMADTKSIAVVDFRGTDQLIKKVTFENPIPLVNGYITLNVSYRYSDTEFFGDFAINTTFLEEAKALHPCYSLGILDVIEREALIHSLDEIDASGLHQYAPLTIGPSVHFKDSVIDCLGIVNVDVSSLIK